MMGSSKLVVADGYRHWLSAVRNELRTTWPAAQTLVAVFQESSGRIGFDLNDEGEEIFSRIIGEAYSWSPKEGGIVHRSAGVSTDYVRSLLVRGQAITLAVAPIQPSLDEMAERTRLASPPHIDTISSLVKLDLDEEEVRFGNGIAVLGRACDRVCVHSVAQWETVVVTTNGDAFLSAIKALCISLEVGFIHVANEGLLPQW